MSDAKQTEFLIGAQAPGRRRRRLLFGAVATAAVAGGAALNWRQSATPAGESDGIDQLLWSQSFEKLDGTKLSLHTLRGSPLLVNFWATWCPPCVEELPMLDAFYRTRKPSDLQVIGVAVDRPQAVRQFLQTTPLSFQTVLAGLAGTQLTRQLGNSAGGLPFSLWLDRSGRLRQRKLGQLKAPEVQRWAAEL